MNQEKIGKLIKKIRKNNNLTQQAFASQFNVTYQAVSKWENGKNIPDIDTLKLICEKYNIDINEILTGTNKKKNNKNTLITIACLILIIIIIALVIFIINKDDDFEFKTLSTTCGNFTISGSMAYNKDISSIYISHIDYCGGEDDKTYKSISCSLYETSDNVKTKISDCGNKNASDVTLEEFLKDVTFKVDNHEKTCKIYTENTLHLEIDATDENGEVTSYKIPLSLSDNCSN